MKFKALTKKLAAEFSDPVHKKLEFIRELMFSKCAHVGSKGENISTNNELCSEILDKMPDMSGLKVMVWFNPEFFFKIRTKYPTAKITLVTGSGQVAMAGFLDQFGTNVTVIQVDPFDMTQINQRVKDMKFNIIIGNPPYQSAAKTGTQPLWPLFVHKSFNMLTNSGILCMITPNKWCGHTANVIKGDIRLYSDCFLGKLAYANIQECSRHFSVGSYADSFSYFIVNNAGVKYSTIQTLTKEFSVNSLYPYLPLKNLDPITFDILNKIKTEKTYSFKQVSTGFANTGSNAIIISMAQRLHYSKLQIYIDNDKNKKATSKSTISRNTYPESSQENIDSIFRSKLYNFLHHIYWNNDNFSTTFYNSLPYLDPNIRWTDDSIARHFSLTTSEIEYINSAVE